LGYFADRRPHEGLTYAAYMELMAVQAAAAPPPDDAEAAERIGYTKLNLHRSQRIARTWRPSGELAALAARLGPQLWMVLTEPWCGDSAQCLPCLAVLADAAPGVDLRLLLRDENLDIMDQFLTDGKRSIPVLVGLDADGGELLRWGPRPAAAQDVVDMAKSEGLAKPDLLERLHLWYGRDRGRHIDAELCVVLGRHLGAGASG
jgi:hypothetical protein